LLSKFVTQPGSNPFGIWRAKRANKLYVTASAHLATLIWDLLR
jgi:hypothetical protein